jgi:hypothetical protein
MARPTFEVKVLVGLAELRERSKGRLLRIREGDDWREAAGIAARLAGPGGIPRMVPAEGAPGDVVKERAGHRVNLRDVSPWPFTRTVTKWSNAARDARLAATP